MNANILATRRDSALHGFQQVGLGVNAREVLASVFLSMGILSGYYHRWQPKSGVAHITLTIDPKAKGPSCTSDGSHFNIIAPSTHGVTDDVWNAKVGSVFDKYQK